MFHEKRHPAEMGVEEVERFLTWLATNQSVAASTQTQALSALLFLYKHVLRIELPPLDAVRAKRPKRQPVVLSRQEVQRLLSGMDRRQANCNPLCRPGQNSAFQRRL